MRRTTIHHKHPQTSLGTGEGQRDPAVLLGGAIDLVFGEIDLPRRAD